MKKITCLIVSILLITVVFAGCSPNGATQASTEPASSSQASTEANSSAAESSAAPASSPKLLIGMSIQGLDNPYYLSLKEGGEIFIDQLKKDGVEAELQILECGSSDEKQVNDIKATIARGGKDTIIYIDALNNPTVATVADICEEAGVYWSSCWGMAEGIYPKDYKYYVMAQTGDDATAGYNVAKAMFSKFKTPYKGTITAIHGMLANSASIRRNKGLQKALAEFPDVKLVDEQVGEWIASKSLQITQSWLAKYNETKLDGIWCDGDDETLGVIEALKAKGLNGKILTCGVDGIPDAVKAIEAGDMAASYASNAWQQGFYGLAFPYAAYKGEIDTAKLTPEQRCFFTSGVLITQDNVAEYKQKYSKEALAPTFDRKNPFAVIARPLEEGE